MFALLLKIMIKTIIISVVLLFAAHAGFAQNICIAFYNQENLFDTIDDPNKNDNEFLPTAKKGWNTEKYTSKINNMAKVISGINNEQAPDIIGMCEVENGTVLNDIAQNKQLKKANYQYVHIDGPDERSIDNALLFKKGSFKLISSKSVNVPLENTKTRDVLLVHLQAKNKAQIVVLVNHFPSRIGGEEKSEPRRLAAAQVVRNICDSLYQLNPQENIVIMGDFNDEPNNKSMDSVLRAKANEYDLNNGNLYNAMYELKQNNEGSHYYKGHFSMLDQIIISSSITNCTGTICYQKSSATIYKQPWMVEAEGKYKGAPFRTFIGDKFVGGYSDHLPVYIMLTLKKK